MIWAFFVLGVMISGLKPMPNLRILGSLFFLAGAGVIVWFWTSSPDIHSESAVGAVSAASGSTPENQLNPGAAESAGASAENADRLENQAPRPAIQPYNGENREWEASRGYTTEYNMHFLQTDFLERRAAHGDMLAAQELGRQRLGTEEGNNYLTDAAILGSIFSLILLSASSEDVADGTLNEYLESQGSEFDQHAYGIRALEYLFVAEIRGDHVAAPNSVPYLMENISYTEQDVSQACAQALQRYAELEQARLDKGLPPFDNSPPPIHNSPTQYSRLCSGT